MRIQSPQSYH